MYILDGQITLDDGTELINPCWKIQNIIDDIENRRVRINVIFYNDTFYIRDRHISDFEYVDTWEDADLYSHILAMPEFQLSTLL